ncbi:MAG: ATP-dependent DNA helicase, partial [Bdellovibrio sp.]
MSRWLQSLNPEQQRAVLYREGPLLILAGAGSGKTTVLVARAGSLIESGVRADSICVLTFTNKAARELKHRVQQKLGRSSRGLWAGTFHSFGLNLLRRHASQAGLPSHFGIIDHSDGQAVLKDLLRTLSVPGRDKFDLEKLLSLINELRLVGRFRSPAEDEYRDVAEVLKDRYLKRLQSLGVVDFEGLLLKPLELLNEHPEIKEALHQSLRYLMVDEFQDTNSLQMELIDSIMNKDRNLAVVGDDDQSIYGWRGAEVTHILDFPKRYQNCEVIRLER